MINVFEINFQISCEYLKVHKTFWKLILNFIVNISKRQIPKKVTSKVKLQKAEKENMKLQKLKNNQQSPNFCFDAL